VPELNDILLRLEPLLGPRGDDPLPLDGGITNRNFRVVMGGVAYVIRLHGENTSLLGIDREAERLANELAAQLGIAPQVVAAIDGCLVTRFLECRQLAAGQVAERVDEIALALRAFHECGAQLPTTFHVPDLLKSYAAMLRGRGAALPESFLQAAAASERIGQALALDRVRPCHNDLLPGNIICAAEDGRMMLVDWEYAGMGDPRFDLGNLSVNNDFDEAAEERLLEVYFGEPATPGRRAALKLMRVLSDAREAAWGLLQAEISELRFDFDRYAQTHFQRLHAAVVEHSFEELLVAAAA
jgi:thiamine kinase-like enzyme